MFGHKGREAKFYFCKNVIISQSHWSLLLSTFWEQAQEIHQTVSCWRGTRGLGMTIRLIVHTNADKL